jgi:flagellar biogenesis protein FliO
VKRLFVCGVTGLALFATGLTGTASADPTPTPVEVLDAPTTQTPLQVRPSKPLALESSPKGASVGWKLLGMVLVAGAGFWLWKRRPSRPSPLVVPELAILRRTRLGVRSELVLVDLDGQRILLGVTPHSVQNLYIVPDAETDEPDVDIETSPYARRLAQLIEPGEEIRSEAPPGPVPPAGLKRSRKVTKPVSDPGNAPVEGQARGLFPTGERR